MARRAGGARKRSSAAPKADTPSRRLELTGAAIVAVSVVTLVSFLTGDEGALASRWIAVLRWLFGWGAWLLPIATGALGGWLMLSPDEARLRALRPRLIAGVVTALTVLAGLHVIAAIALPPSLASTELSHMRSIAVAGAGGGRIGYAVAYALARNLGVMPSLAALLLAVVVGAAFTLGSSVRATLHTMGGGLFLLFGRPVQRASAAVSAAASNLSLGTFASGMLTRVSGRAEDSDEELDGAQRGSGAGADLGQLGGDIDDVGRAAGADSVDAESAADQRSGRAAAAADSGAAEAAGAAGATADARAGGQAPAAAEAPSLGPAGDQLGWRLPEIEAIFEDSPTAEVVADDAEPIGAKLEQTLEDFGIPAKVVSINRGPRVTQFGLEPGYTERSGRRSRVKVSRIVSLQNDLALAVARAPLRIQAPVPGRPYVGIEVPNAVASVVPMRSILESNAFRKAASGGRLPIALGRDIGGHAVAADLAQMPHLLIAGATGAGKSVAINALICSLLVMHSPTTLKLLLVDPKRVEMAGYRGLPHLAAPVVVEIERVVGVLQWVVREMDRRYRSFAEEGVRNIEGWNARAGERGLERLPYLVIVIDELADLMMVAPEEAERLITRLAQLARATGIHLVLATQRPSVDVVTGLIKANFPARIAFAVSSGVDSRVILDASGAEKLLGMGDMLYMASDSSRLHRVQGCLVGDIELSRLTRHWKYNARTGDGDGEGAGDGATDGQAAGADQDMSLTLGLPEPLIQPELWDKMLAGQDDLDRDALWDQAVELISRHETASTSFLQRKLRVGYARAARILDQMEAEGLVGPQEGNAGRAVLIGDAEPETDPDGADGSGLETLGPDARTRGAEATSRETGAAGLDASGTLSEADDEAHGRS